MTGIIAAAINKRKITLVIILAVALFGWLSYDNLPRQENPDITPPVALVTTIYPGASPSDIERLVSQKIEDAASEIDDFDHVESFSRNSVSIVVVFLKISAKPDKAWRQLRNKIDDVQPDLPEMCKKPHINTNLSETAGMMIALSGEAYDYDQLADFADVFKKELARVQGVSRFDIDGEINKQVMVRVDSAKLNQYRLSFDDLVNILRAQNIAIPSGALRQNGVKIDVSVPGAYASVRDIGNTIVDVSTKTGAVVRLRDLAHVQLEDEEGAYRLRQNGAKAVLLVGYFERGENIVHIGHRVRQVLDRVKARFPKDLHVDEVLYYPSDVEQAVNGFMLNLLQGILLVIIVVFLGMGLRNAAIVSVSIPLSVLATFSMMNLLGLQIHQISTAALIIALGMLVDNAIVIADAIQTRVDANMDRVEAAYAGARESAIPVFTATLTTVAAYFPLLVLPGAVGDFVEAIPLIVMISLSASYLVAMLVTPMLAAIFFRPQKKTNAAQGWVRRPFMALLDLGMEHKFLTVFIGFAALAAAIFLQSQQGLSFFPHADKNIMHMTLNAERMDLDSSEALAAQVEDVLQQMPEISSVTTAIGKGLPKFFVTVPRYHQAENFAQIMFRFDLSKSTRFADVDALQFYLQRKLQQSISAGRVAVKILELADPSAAPVVLRLSGEDQDQLARLSKTIQQAIRKIPGTMEVGDDSTPDSLGYSVESDSDVATSMGISAYDIQRQINVALYGGEASVFRSAGHEYKIVVKSDIGSVAELENMAIKSRIAGHKVLLKQFADVQLRPRSELITHYQKERSIALTSFVQPGYSSAEIEAYIESQILPKIALDGVRVSFDGEREKIKKNFGNVGVSALLALIAVYLILMVQFNSFRQPLIILLTVPMSVIGSIFALFFAGQSLSFPAILGMASLIGVVVNNAILLMDFVNKALAKGYRINAACSDAVDKRIRPIGLSTVTTVVGLTPLLFSNKPLFVPMSLSLVGGLIGSTLLTMVVIPVVVSLFMRDKRA